MIHRLRGQFRMEMGVHGGMLMKGPDGPPAGPHRVGANVIRPTKQKPLTRGSRTGRGGFPSR